MFPTANDPSPPFEWKSWILGGLGLTAGIFGVFLICSFLISDFLARRRDAERRQLAALEALRSARETAANANSNLAGAEQWLIKADYELKSNAYAPFWDAIENGARFLDLCHANYAAIQNSRRIYYNALEPSGNTFPVLEECLVALNDPTPALREFQRLVRLGQTNLGFAQIWEHRATRQSIVAGFQTLADGIRQLETTMVKSLDELRRSVSSDLARVIHFQGRILSILEAATGSPNR